jgi:hypothetical protein
MLDVLDVYDARQETGFISRRSGTHNVVIETTRKLRYVSHRVPDL